MENTEGCTENRSELTSAKVCGNASEAILVTESISGRLRYVDRHLPYVGKDAIYAYVASVHGRSLERYLWWKGKKYKPRIPRG